MKTKYPRTPHLGYSPGRTSDDKVIESLDSLIGKNVVVTLKMDGENTTMYSDAIHARSLDSNNHPSRDWVKQFHASIKHKIPHGWRICGENLYAKHSIHYTDLRSYFLGFSIWTDENICLSWLDTLEIFDDIGISPVDTIYHGEFIEKDIENLTKLSIVKMNEGFVVRNSDSFHYDDFSKNVVKYVRKNHVTTDQHWMNSKIIPNELGYFEDEEDEFEPI